MKKSIYKKWWFWVVMIILIIGIGNALNEDSESKKADKSSTVVSKTEKKSDSKEEVKQKPKEEKEVTKPENKNESKTTDKKEEKTNTTVKQNSPKEVVETYFSSWKNKDYKTMYKVAQPTWKKKNKEDVIEAWYDFKTLKSFEIKAQEENNMKISDKDLTMTKVTVKVTYESLQGKNENKIIVANTIKEEGRWWVNPTSTLREE